MRHFSLRRPTPLALLTCAAAALGFGCSGSIAGSSAGPDAGGSPEVPRAGAGGTPGAGGTASSGNSGGSAVPPSLPEVAGEYFPGQSAAGAPKRVFRLTRTQLDLTTRTLLPELVAESATASLPSDPLQTNYEYADNLGFNAANFTPFTNWVAEIAAAAKAAPESVVDCASSNDSPDCLGEAARAFASRAFRGTASEAQLARYADFFVADAASAGVPEATGALVDLVLTSPHYVFRDEVLTDAAGTLLPAQQLQAITYTLADAPPETLGLSSAAPSSHVGTPELTQRTIERVLESPEARQKLLRFFLAWLEVKEPDEFTIAESTFPEFTEDVAAAVVEETRSFLEQQLSRAVPKLSDVTATNPPSVSGVSAFLYDGSASASAAIELDPSQRLGIFTQPAVLASHSGPTTTRLVKRGVFFVRKVMCMPLGAPPEDADTTPATDGSTERERIETATSPPRCAGCHSFINPFGFMLENYDAIGRFRTDDEGAPVDASIEVDFLDEGPFRAESPVDALRTFTRSWRFQQCFARQLFRFYLGRDETTADDPILRQLFEEFAADEGQDILQMLRTLAGSTTFSQRTEAP